MKYIDAGRLIEYLEKEADKEFNKTEENANSPVICHFHNGCRMQALDTIDFIKNLQQEQPSEDLDKAAQEYAVRYDMGTCGEIIIDGFRAGAQWQKEQMMKELEGWKELAIRGMKKGATAYHQGKVALITDLEEWLKED